MPTKEAQNRKLAAQSALDPLPLPVAAKPIIQHPVSTATGFARQNSNGVVSDEDLRKAFQVAAQQHSDHFNANQAAHPHPQHLATGMPVNGNTNAVANSYEGFPPTSTYLPQGPVEYNTTAYPINAALLKPQITPFFPQPPPLPRPPSHPSNGVDAGVYAIAGPAFHYQQTPAVAANTVMPALAHPMSVGGNEWPPGVSYNDPNLAMHQGQQLHLQQIQMQMQMQLAMQQAAHSQAMSQTPNSAQEMGFYGGVRPSFSRENSLTQGFQTKDNVLQQFAGQIGYMNPVQQTNFYLQMQAANEMVQNGSPQYFPGLSRPNSLNSAPTYSRPNSLVAAISLMPTFSRPNSMTSSPGSDSDLPSMASTPLTLNSAHSVDSSCDEHSPHHSDNESFNGGTSSRGQSRVKAATHSAACPSLAHGMCFHHLAGHPRQGAKKSSSEKCAGHTVLHRFLSQQPGVKAEIQGRIARGLIDNFQLSCTFDGEDVCRNCWNALQLITSPVSKGGLGLPLVVYGVTVYFMDYGDAQKGALRNRGTRRHMTYTSDVNGCKGVPLQGEAAMELSAGASKSGARKRQRSSVPDSNSRSHFHKLLLPCLPLCAGLAGQFEQAVSAKGAAIYFKLRDCTPTNKKKANKRKILEYDLIAGGSNNLCRLCAGAQKKSVDERDEADAESEHKAANEDDKRGNVGKDFMKSIQLAQSVEVMWLPTSIFTAWETARKTELSFKETTIKYEEISEDKEATDAAKSGKGKSTLRVRKRVKRDQNAESDEANAATTYSSSSATLSDFSSSSSSSTSADSLASSLLPASIPVLSRPNSLTSGGGATSVGYIGSLAANAAAATTVSNDFILGPHRTSLSLDSSLMLSEGESDVDAEFDVLAFGVDSSEFVNPFSSSALLSGSSVAASSAVGSDLMDTSAMLKLAGMDEEGRLSAAPAPVKTVRHDSEGRGARRASHAGESGEGEDEITIHEEGEQEGEIEAPVLKIAVEDLSVEKKAVASRNNRAIRLPISFQADDELFVQLSVNSSGEVSLEDGLQRLSLTDKNNTAEDWCSEIGVKIFVFRLVAKNGEETQAEDEDEDEDADEEEIYESDEQQLNTQQKEEELKSKAQSSTPLYD